MKFIRRIDSRFGEQCPDLYEKEPGLQPAWITPGEEILADQGLINNHQPHFPRVAGETFVLEQIINSKHAV